MYHMNVNGAIWFFCLIIFKILILTSRGTLSLDYVKEYKVIKYTQHVGIYSDTNKLKKCSSV